MPFQPCVSTNQTGLAGVPRRRPSAGRDPPAESATQRPHSPGTRRLISPLGLGPGMIIRGGPMDSRIRTMEIVDDRVAEILRSKSPAERLAIANGMWRFARRMIREIIARDHPGW